jgi:hypothetical protein
MTPSGRPQARAPSRLPTPSRVWSRDLFSWWSFSAVRPQGHPAPYSSSFLSSWGSRELGRSLYFVFEIRSCSPCPCQP